MTQKKCCQGFKETLWETVFSVSAIEVDWWRHKMHHWDSDLLRAGQVSYNTEFSVLFWFLSANCVSSRSGNLQDWDQSENKSVLNRSGWGRCVLICSKSGPSMTSQWAHYLLNQQPQSLSGLGADHLWLPCSYPLWNLWKVPAGGCKYTANC